MATYTQMPGLSLCQPAGNNLYRVRQKCGCAVNPFCPHCGKPADMWFDRTLPMCYRCSACGKELNVYYDDDLTEEAFDAGTSEDD